ncbi:ureidoglycolate lyase, partial [Pseudomonadales bacterium]|nr:ureidoglycolate lyase [Pseudomonadales bacterium]
MSTQQMKIKPVPLTAASFAPYGDVIEPEAAQETRTINDGHTLRFHDLATLSLGADGGIPLLNIFRSTPLKLPLSLSIMERHPLSSQAFIPLSDNPYLVIVAPPGELDESMIKVFKASSKQGVNYHPG